MFLSEALPPANVLAPISRFRAVCRTGRSSALYMTIETLLAHLQRLM